MKRKPNFKTVQKIEVFMKEIYDELQKGNKITFKDITQKHHISTRVSTAIVDLGIVERISWGRGGVTYKWLAGEPTVKLAETVSKKANSMKKKEVSKSKLIAGRDFSENLFRVELPKITDETRKEMKQDIDRVMLESIVESMFLAYGFKKPKAKKRLKWRNPFYWV